MKYLRDIKVIFVFLVCISSCSGKYKDYEYDIDVNDVSLIKESYHNAAYDSCKDIELLERNSRDEIKLDLKSDTNIYTWGEPLSIAIELTNVSESPLNIFDELGPYENHIRFYIENPSGDVKPYYKSIHLGTRYLVDKYKGEELRPGESKRFVATLFSGRNLPEPGTYGISVVYRVPDEYEHLAKGTVVSNKLTMELKEPSEAEKVGITEFQELGFEDMMTEDWLYSPMVTETKIELRSKLKEIIESTPTSPITKHAKYYYAAMHVHDDPGKALELIKDVEAVLPEFRKAGVHYIKCFCYQKLGMTRELEQINKSDVIYIDDYKIEKYKTEVDLTK